MNRPRFSGDFRRGFLLGGVSLTLLAVLWQGLSQPPPAYAQVPDSGAQRAQMIRELTTANRKLTEITDLLKDIRAINAGEASPKKTPKPGRARP